MADGAFSGVPTDTSVKPNVAWEKAAAVIGSGDATTLGTYMNVVSTADDILAERTTKLGLHVILSQDDDYTQQNQGVMLQPQALIQKYQSSSTWSSAS